VAEGRVKEKTLTEDKMKTLRKLNKDEITLLKLLTDAYLFANLSDVGDSKWDRECQSTLSYVTVNHVNGLDANLCSTVCNPIAKAIVNIIGQELFEEWTSFSTFVVDELLDLIDQKLEKQKKEEKRMEMLCSGNYENVLDLIERAKQYYVWVQTSEDDGFYDYVGRKGFEDKMVDKIEENNCNIKDLYLDDDGDLYYKEWR